MAWPYAGITYSAQYWRHRNHSCFAPVFKLHREPIAAISSLAAGFDGRNQRKGLRKDP